LFILLLPIISIVYTVNCTECAEVPLRNYSTTHSLTVQTPKICVMGFGHPDFRHCPLNTTAVNMKLKLRVQYSNRLLNWMGKFIFAL